MTERPEYIQNPIIPRKPEIMLREYSDGRKTVIRRERNDRIAKVSTEGSLQNFKSVCKEFSIFTGIKLPKWEIRYDESAESEVVEVEYIEGTALERLSRFETIPFDTNIVEEIFIGYAYYLNWCYKFNKPYLADFKLAQLVLSGDTLDSVYYIDMDFYTANPYVDSGNALASKPFISRLWGVITEFKDIEHLIKLKNIPFGANFRELMQNFGIDIDDEASLKSFRSRELNESRQAFYGVEAFANTFFAQKESDEEI